MLETCSECYIFPTLPLLYQVCTFIIVSLTSQRLGQPGVEFCGELKSGASVNQLFFLQDEVCVLFKLLLVLFIHYTCISTWSYMYCELNDVLGKHLDKPCRLEKFIILKFWKGEAKLLFVQLLLDFTWNFPKFSNGEGVQPLDLTWPGHDSLSKQLLITGNYKKNFLEMMRQWFILKGLIVSSIKELNMDSTVMCASCSFNFAFKHTHCTWV